MLGRQFTCTPPVVFFFSWPNISAKRSAIARFIIKTIIYGVWLFRNIKSTFRNVKDNYRAIIRYVSFDISSRVRVDSLRLTSSCFLSAVARGAAGGARASPSFFFLKVKTDLYKMLK